MSTHDSYLLCWSSVITQDVVAPLKRGAMTTRSRIRLTRGIIIIIGIFIWAWGLFYKGSDRIWDYMIITGAIYFTGAMVLLTGGLYWKPASRTGAMLGLIFGSSALLGLEPIRVRLIQTASLLLQGNPDYWLNHITSSVVGLMSVRVCLFLWRTGGDVLMGRLVQSHLKRLRRTRRHLVPSSQPTYLMAQPLHRPTNGKLSLRKGRLHFLQIAPWGIF